MYFICFVKVTVSCDINDAHFVQALHMLHTHLELRVT